MKIVDRAIKNLEKQHGKKLVELWDVAELMPRRVLNKMSTPELIMALELTTRKVPYYLDVKKGKYRMDIFIPTNLKNKSSFGIDLEIDGAFWHDREETKNKDKERDRYMSENFVFTIRLDTKEVEQNVISCANELVRLYEVLIDQPLILTNEGLLKKMARQMIRNRKKFG